MPPCSQGDAEVSAEVPRGQIMFVEILWGTAEVFCGYTGIRDKRIRDKSPRMGEDFSLGKDKTLREFILIILGVQD